jgi:hypothetical protein
MKKTRLLLFTLLTLLLAVAMACSLLDLLNPPPTPVPTEEVATTVIEPTESEPEPTAEPTPTDEPEPTLEPTEIPPNRGQIAYVADGNVWRYLVDSGEMIQVTFDGVADSYEGGYGSPLFSADGRYLSYMKNNVSYLHNLADNSVVSLPVMIFQWSQTQPATFYAAQGSFTCPAVEDLENQELISFDLLRYDADDPVTPLLLATIGGGLKYPQAISDDEQYLSVLNCACYSECGTYVLWHIPTTTSLASPEDIYAGKVDFSPDSTRLVTSRWQMYGYLESPLYLANSDFSGVVTLYSEPNVAAVDPLWSPDGGWIAFTAYDIAEEFELSDKRVLIINLDGSEQLEIADGNAELANWSPDGSQILFWRGERDAYTPYIYDLLSGTITELPFTAAWQMDWSVLP